MDIFVLLQVLVSGLISGFIVFQSAFVAPIVFKTLPQESRPPFLRTIFPKLFKAMAFCGVLLLIFNAMQTEATMLGYFVGGFTLICGVVCNGLIPQTNRAKDEGDDKRFAFLHKVSVVSTVTTLLVNVAWVFWI